MRRRQVQDEQRERDVHGLWCGLVFGGCWSYCYFQLCELPRELKCAGLELGHGCLYLQCRIHRRKRGCVLRMRRRQVQDEQRECRVYGLCGGDLLGDSRRKCVHGVCCGRRLSSGKHGVRI